MLRSTYCCLNEHTDKELTDLGECPYDQVSHLQAAQQYVGDDKMTQKILWQSRAKVHEEVKR